MVDPGFVSEELEQAVQQVGVENVEAILLTHGHYDHIMGVPMIKEMTGAKIYIHQEDAAFTSNSDLNLSRMIAARQCVPFTADVILQEGDTLMVGVGAGQADQYSWPYPRKQLLFGGGCFVYRRYPNEGYHGADRLSNRKSHGNAEVFGTSPGFAGGLPGVSGPWRGIYDGI